jgi:hypothetical protein
MATDKRAKPITFQIRPAVGGLNVSKAPQVIDYRESPSLMNVRFNKGLIQHRTGFSLKYQGCREAPLWIDTVYAVGEQNVVCFTKNGAYYRDAATDVMLPIDIYDGDGGVTSFPHFTMDPTTDFLCVDVGNGTVDFGEGLTANFANGGAVFGPDDITVVCNGADGILIMVYTGGAGTPVEGQFLHSTWALGCPTFGLCCAIFNSMLVVGGVLDSYTTVQWSSKGRFDHWDTATYADTGSQVIGDSPDWILTMKKLGEYLIVYKERSIYIGRKSFLADPALIFDPAPGQGIGLAAPNSVGDLGEEHIFLGWDDVYVFSLKGIDPIGTRIKEDLFYGEDGIIPKFLGNCTGVIAEEFDEYWLMIPTGKWPEDANYGGDGPEGSVENVCANPCFLDYTGENPDNWAEDTDGGGTTTIETGGLFGPDILRIEKSSGDYYGQIGDLYDHEAVIDDETISVLVWAKADGACTLRITPYTADGSGANQTAQTHRDITLATSSSFACYRHSFVVDDADGEQVQVALHVRDANGVKVDIDCVQIVRMEDISTEYWYGVTGQFAPGFLGPGGEVQLIPFIVDRVGQWIPDTVWVYNYEENAWSKWRLPVSGFGYDSIQDVITIGSLEGYIDEQTWRYDEKRIQALAPTNLIGGPDGQIWEMSSDKTYDWEDVVDAPLLAYWESKDFDLDRPDVDKTFSRLVIYHESSHGAVTLTVGVSTDSGITWSDQDIVIRAGYTNTFADFFVTVIRAGSELRTLLRDSSFRGSD